MSSRTALISLAIVLFAVAAPDASADSKPPGDPINAPKTCGQGVCKRTVNAPVCTPGQPITANDGWLTKADPSTQSWDANCDGKVEREPRDLSDYKIGCHLEDGACVTSSGRFDCGDTSTLSKKCELATKPDGTKYCNFTLLGSFVQRCR